MSEKINFIIKIRTSTAVFHSDGFLVSSEIVSTINIQFVSI